MTKLSTLARWLISRSTRQSFMIVLTWNVPTIRAVGVTIEVKSRGYIGTATRSGKKSILPSIPWEEDQWVLVAANSLSSAETKIPFWLCSELYQRICQKVTPIAAEREALTTKAMIKGHRPIILIIDWFIVEEPWRNPEAGMRWQLLSEASRYCAPDFGIAFGPQNSENLWTL